MHVTHMSNERFANVARIRIIIIIIKIIIIIINNNNNNNNLNTATETQTEDKVDSRKASEHSARIRQIRVNM